MCPWLVASEEAENSVSRSSVHQATYKYLLSSDISPNPSLKTCFPQFYDKRNQLPIKKNKTLSQNVRPETYPSSWKQVFSRRGRHSKSQSYKILIVEQRWSVSQRNVFFMCHVAFRQTHRFVLCSWARACFAYSKYKRVTRLHLSLPLEWRGPPGCSHVV